MFVRDREHWLKVFGDVDIERNGIALLASLLRRWMTYAKANWDGNKTNNI